MAATGEGAIAKLAAAATTACLVRAYPRWGGECGASGSCGLSGRRAVGVAPALPPRPRAAPASAPAAARAAGAWAGARWQRTALPALTSSSLTRRRKVRAGAAGWLAGWLVAHSWSPQLRRTRPGITGCCRAGCAAGCGAQQGRLQAQGQVGHLLRWDAAPPHFCAPLWLPCAAAASQAAGCCLHRPPWLADWPGTRPCAAALLVRKLRRLAAA